ncbi:D-galactose 1-dehydrogenase [Sphingobium sp. OAS761]|uniref:Gfo/Idh/MocA family protein n=1 Tax=Sphingobium sp. OAS761 TaxID=2817901 RepID=UPI0020A16593|nr:Gfo/Idh/MocA family oxidoreductase [Sphingobium sp. OAS761]MCP1469249.1 D-galactose 1-dehydrogenase [Sphingobium sp. OAS761]
MSALPIALAGIGKIARDQHVPTLAESGDFELVAAVTGHEAPQGIPAFPDIDAMMAAMPQVKAIAICTPPRGRLALVEQALGHGLHVMIEKPPAATLSEAEAFARMAAEAGRTFFASWHSRAAAGVAPALDWLRGRTIRNVTVNWKEDVRFWHPGQEWIWEPGIGVFDPGINALSVITRLLPHGLILEEADLRFPANRQAPIAADLHLDSAGVPVRVAFDFDQRGPQTWMIDIETDHGLLTLTDGASRMAVDGAAVDVGNEGEYPRLYRHFAQLIAAGRSDIDLTPFRLVADAFLLGRRTVVEPFDWI